MTLSFLCLAQLNKTQNWEGDTEKTGSTVALINDNHRIKINDYSLSFFPF